MKVLLLCGVLAALTSVVLGAFAAHGLKGTLSDNLLQAFRTGVEYQMYHGLGIILIAILYRLQSDTLLVTSAGLMLAGIVLFSGSLYMLALTGMRGFGPVTPLGGICFILGWSVLFYAIYRNWV